MYLRKLKLYGFKSFADRTELEFDPRLLAIVGPNGCGKSNIVDAILWGLGEHNPRNLRAENAADFIFAGSARRKALGYAEVQLIFDNEDGVLPYPAAEVAVTRRVMQDGQGEYFINNKPCRLKDIVDLFADTGLGRTGYAIVSQREVDAVLSADPHERRVLLDEAAGVQRFRARREDTVRRLEQASYHLQRAQDLLSEIERQIEPLERQAADAVEYQQARDRLRQLEVGLLLRDVYRLTENVRQLDEGLGQLGREIERLDDSILDGDRDSKLLTEAVVEAEKKLDAARLEQQEAQAALQKAESRFSLCIERSASAKALAAVNLERASSIADEASRLEDELRLAEERLSRSRADLASKEPSLDTALLEQLRAQLSEKLAEQAALREAELAYNRIEAERRQAVLQICRLRDEAAEVRRRYNTVSIRANEAARSQEDTERVLEQARTEAEEARHRFEQANERKQALQAEAALAEQEHAALRATLEALRSAIPGDACAALLQAPEAQGVSRLAALLRVEPKYRKALDAALGPVASALLASDAELAQQLIEVLASLGQGRGTVVHPVPEDPPAASVIRDEAQRLGALGLAEDFVRAEEPCLSVVRRMLQGTILVPDLVTAKRLLSWQADWRQVVTLSGEVFRKEGVAEAGDFRGRVSIEADLRDLAEQEDQSRRRAEELRDRLEETELALAQALTHRSEAEQRLEEARRAADAAHREVKEAQGELRFLSERIEALDASIELATQSLHGELEPPDPLVIEKVEHEIAELRREIASIEADARRSDRDREAIAARVSEVEAEVARLQDRLQQCRNEQQQAEERLAELSAQIARADSETQEAEREREEALVSKQLADERFEEARSARAQAVELAFGASEKVQSLRQEREALLARSHELQLERARAEVRRANALRSLVEEHDIAEEEAEAMLASFELPEGAVQEAAALRRELRRLGEVNLGAVEALRALKERRDSMVAQRDDLLESRNQILTAMREIENATKNRFLETLEAVNTELPKVFTRLFDGGSVELRLTDPADVMASGVEIDVQLPGKRKQRMELLSGGERALTAVAFLFAMLRVRPSPLCILDEVDAALDGRNVERFCELLTEYAEQMQFLVVTHNAVTIETSQVWYGVTMQEPGVSTVIPFGRGARAVVSAQG